MTDFNRVMAANLYSYVLCMGKHFLVFLKSKLEKHKCDQIDTHFQAQNLGNTNHLSQVPVVSPSLSYLGRLGKLASNLSALFQSLKRKIF